ncbi:MAG TPA: hypothetical protein VHH88_01165, partial [Verrucomicrobiae bacterium]|nr:hypothetical protein [Verrucomicrobiae bacterium]
MKNISFTILVAAAVLGLGLYFREVGTAHSIKSELASTRQKNAELQARAMEAESRVKTLEIRLKESRTRAAEEAGEAARLQRTLATTSAASKASTASGQGPQTNKANSMAAMFKNPEMRDFIKNQQKTVLGPMITKNYGPFITGLNLTPDQAQGLKDLLVKKALAGADAGLSIMSGDLDPAKRDEIMQQAKSEKDAV